MTEGKRRVDIQEAARLLDTTEGAIRKRAQRGTLEAEKGDDGRVYVRVEAGHTRHDERQDTGKTEASGVEDELRARIESLERQLEEANTRDRENRRLLAAALERMPELESHTEPREGGEEESISSTEDPAEPERGTRRPWWKRIFGD